MEFKTLSIVIPVYNEEPTIHRILHKIRNTELINNLEKEIILVNDCSKDKTEEMILQFIQENPDLRIKYEKHDKNFISDYPTVPAKWEYGYKRFPSDGNPLLTNPEAKDAKKSFNKEINLITLNVIPI